VPGNKLEVQSIVVRDPEKHLFGWHFSKPMFHKNNAKTFELEMAWFGQVLDARMKHYFQEIGDVFDPLDIAAPDLQPGDSTYGALVDRCKFGPAERLTMMLALAPDLNPSALDIFYTQNRTLDRPFTEFGGIRGRRHVGFIPTIETAFFLLAGGDLKLRLKSAPLFEHLHAFHRSHILDIDFKNQSEPFASAPLRLHQDVLDMLLLGYEREPEMSVDFPARRIETRMNWEDLVLSSQTRCQLKELRAWLYHGDTLLNHWRMEKYLKPGYRCLFYGPPGTGKTLTACLLGKRLNRSVFRIDLSRLVSKYVGETEKNLEKIFHRAAQRNWILFFDEADALFGKRTEVIDAQDRYANQETAFLLQRLEDCPNTVILASNLKTNIDEAFTRRFQSTVYFPIPAKTERLKLWQQGLGPIPHLESSVDLEQIAQKYELAGGAIINIIRYCALMAVECNSAAISHDDLLLGINREFKKEGRLPG
jgi:hypothetical protein